MQNGVVSLVVVVSSLPDALSKEIGHISIYLMLVNGCMDVLPGGVVRSAVSSLMGTVFYVLNKSVP